MQIYANNQRTHAKHRKSRTEKETELEYLKLQSRTITERKEGRNEEDVHCAITERRSQNEITERKNRETQPKNTAINSKNKKSKKCIYADLKK